MPIPERIHFLWLGERLPAVPYLAVRAALDRSGIADVRLHLEPAATAHPAVRDLDQRGCTLMPLTNEGVLGQMSLATRSIYEVLSDPASRTNVLRLAVLERDGGIYLDTDVITLRSLRPLLEEQGFAGIERIVFPARLYESRNPVRWLGALARTTVRDAVRRTFHDAGAAFERIQHLYPRAANNAVMGAEPRHWLIRAALQRIELMDEAEVRRRFRLGPQLLERVTGNRSVPGFRLLPPPAFYPLPPEICYDYVRDDPDGRLGDVPHPETYAAHLYDSVLRRRLRRPLDAAYLRQTRGRTLLARMVEPYLDDLFTLA